MAPGRDRINQLPADILDHILGLLPIKNAARTAVLSSIWRGAWSSLTHLNFDYRFFGHIDRKYYLKYRRPKKYNKEYAPSLYVINKVLLQHKGTIRKFVLNFFNVGKLTFRYRSFDFDQWLILVTKKGVEEMYIGFDEKACRLPSCIFSCLTLKRLHLCGVIVEPMNLPRVLPNVVSLCFEHVDFGPTNLLFRAVDAPLLENLSFLSCQNMFHFNITATKLCSLTIKCCSSKVSDKFLPVNLNLKSIRTLELEGSLQLEGVTSGCVDALLKLLEKLDYAAQTNKLLQALKVISFGRSQTEILFIGKLLASFSTLKKVVIDRGNMYYRHKKDRITKELLHFHGASTKAEIIFV